MDYIELKATIVPLETGRDILVAELSEIGYESFVETSNGVAAYIPENIFSEELIKNMNINSVAEYTISYISNKIKDQNWNEIWEQSFDPIVIKDKCVVRAPFHEKPLNVSYDIIIEPKMSFGTGHHETTHLMIERLLDLDLRGLNVLDMGCGTGVLAILSKMKGASSILAVDIDEWSFNNTKENIENNEIYDIDVKMGGAELIEGLKFDLIIANINRNVLLNDMKSYTSALNPRGNLLLSGFFNFDKQTIIEEANKYQFVPFYSGNKNDWTMLHLNRENEK